VFSSPYGNSHSQGIYLSIFLFISFFVWAAVIMSCCLAAEFAMGQIILLARQLGDRSREMLTGNWQKVWSQVFLSPFSCR